ncbi:hypothetical protein LJC63_11120, partial [Ruminococcaceae bacterium OttesenSCG-928-L11]|nr:hypothetical protein [Ruminococcaceae bacterium OttesenSCG-928-L11]
ARYSALLPHARSILAQQNMSPALAEINQKLMTFAEHAAMEVDRQLSQTGRAELPLADMSHRFDLDLYDNKTMWDTASRMVAERLDEWDLDFEVDKNMFVAVDYDIQNIIETCKNRIPFDPLVAPSDQEWGVRRVANTQELLEKFEHGNWSVRTGFVLGDLAFIEQIGGGDEWLSLKHDGDTWHRFDSISFGHMIEQSDIDYCRGHLEYLATAPANELLRQPDTAHQQSVPDAIAPEMHEKLIEDIARRNCFVDSLAIQNRDSLDFHDVSVWGLKSALEEAYRAGMQAQAEQNLSPQQEVEPPEPTQEIGPMMGM